MSWMELKLFLPSTNVPADATAARHWLAKLSTDHQKPLPPQFWNKTALSPSAIRFGVLKEGVRIYGIGREGVELLEAHASTIRRLYSTAVGVPVMEQRLEGESRVIMSPYPVKYELARTVIQPQKDQTVFIDILNRHNRKVPSDDPVIQAHLIKQIRAGLVTQITLLHAQDNVLEQPNDDGQITINDIMHAPIEIVCPGEVCFVPVGGASKKALMSIKGASFVSPFKLQGIWHVGRLRARGYGKCTLLRGGAA